MSIYFTASTATKRWTCLFVGFSASLTMLVFPHLGPHAREIVGLVLFVLATGLLLGVWPWRAPAQMWRQELICYIGGLGLILSGQLHLLAHPAGHQASVVLGGLLAQLAPVFCVLSRPTASAAPG